MSLLGPQGLQQVAADVDAAHAATRRCADAYPGVRLAFDRPRFHEAVLLLDRPVGGVLEALARRGIVGGYDISRALPGAGQRVARLRDRDTHAGRHRAVCAQRSGDVAQSAAAA
jgi:glycine cleavage system pyridoxal-binding protein P